MSVVFITNIPAPYREKVHEIVSEKLEYTVIYCSRIESNRKWKFKLGVYDKVFLSSFKLSFNNKTVYLFSDIIRQLRLIDPSVVILGGLSLPMFLAFVWAKLHRRKVVSFSDATIKSEMHLSLVKKILRKVVYKNVDAHIGASLKTKSLFENYSEKIPFFQSHLCADNVNYLKYYSSPECRDFDLILCGQFIPLKMFDFSIEVIKELKKLKPDLSVKLVGDGPLRDQILSALEDLNVEYRYQGFVSPAYLAPEYASARVLLFPTIRDAWGVVVNEAFAAGTVVVTCDEAGAANELVLDNVNGRVLPLEINLWVQAVHEILLNSSMLHRFSQAAICDVGLYNYKNAASGIVEASLYVESKKK